MSRNPDIQRLLASLREGGLVGNESPASIPSDWTTSIHGQQQAATSNSTTPNLGLHVDEKPFEATAAPARSLTPRPNNPQPQSSTLLAPDASMIVTWPAAVKFVGKHIVPNGKIEAKIKRLITDQHKYERDWWDKREIIVRKHSGRADNQQKAAELLRSLGGQYIPVEPADPVVDLAELEAYDLKVHKTLTQMSAHHDQELRQSGIPFFAIKHNLVIGDGEKDNTASSKGRLNRGELRELQRRMAVHLEELFGEEDIES